jgi:hypothetical protein
MSIKKALQLMKMLDHETELSKKLKVDFDAKGNKNDFKEVLPLI